MVVDASSCKSYCRTINNNFCFCQTQRWSWQGWSFHPYFRLSLWVWMAGLDCLHIRSGKERGRDKHRTLGNTLGQRSWGGWKVACWWKVCWKASDLGQQGAAFNAAKAGWSSQRREEHALVGLRSFLLSWKISAEWLTYRILVCPSNLLLLRVSSRFCFLWDACVESIFVKAKLMHWNHDCMFYRRK